MPPQHAEPLHPGPGSPNQRRPQTAEPGDGSASRPPSGGGFGVVGDLPVVNGRVEGIRLLREPPDIGQGVVPEGHVVPFRLHRVGEHPLGKSTRARVSGAAPPQGPGNAGGSVDFGQVLPVRAVVNCGKEEPLPVRPRVGVGDHDQAREVRGCGTEIDEGDVRTIPKPSTLDIVADLHEHRPESRPLSGLEGEKGREGRRHARGSVGHGIPPFPFGSLRRFTRRFPLHPLWPCGGAARQVFLRAGPEPESSATEGQPILPKMAARCAATLSLTPWSLRPRMIAPTSAFDGTFGSAMILPPGAVRLLLFGEPGTSRAACLEGLRTLTVDVQVAGLRTLARMLLRDDGASWSGLETGLLEPPHLVAVLDDGRELLPPPPVQQRGGALWVRIRGFGSGPPASSSGWDRVLREPVSQPAWSQLLTDARGAGPFRRRPGPYLAADFRGPDHAPEPPPATGSGVGPLRVLLVEDDPVVAAVTRHHLEREGALVDVARGHESAMERFMSRAWDLVLTDIRLGLDSGVQLVADMRRFEREEVRERTRILAFGEAPEGRVAVAGGVAGFDGRVGKPLCDLELRAELRQLRPDRRPDSGHPRDTTETLEDRRVIEASRGLLIGEVPQLVALLRAAAADRRDRGDNVLAALGHRLRGASSAVGEVGLAQAAKALEKALVKGRPDRPGAGRPGVDPGAAVERLITELERMRTASERGGAAGASRRRWSSAETRLP
ncbi:MAG: response regulator [Gemmatimonadales bacterium]|nr:MAG: response regulator [Gemmatimonadales bacterium]